jgi:hypothetical protein
MEQLVQTRSVKQDAEPSPLLAHMAFHLTGKRSRGLDAIDELDLRPALLAGYRDLTALRYDFPLVLTPGVKDATAIRPLSALFDGILERCAVGAEGERLRKHGLRLEREIRLLAANGARGSLSDVWAEAARRLCLHGDELLQDSLKRLREALDGDGELLDCDAGTAARLFRHLWQAVQDEKALRFRALADALTMRLSDILRAEQARSEDGRSAESLSASFGSTHRDAFDFAVMSRLLTEATPPASLPDARRQRIRRLISVLASQRFFPATQQGAEASGAIEPHPFIFEDSAAAIEAYRARLPEAIELVKALAMARLEVEGEYIDARHDAFFADFGADNIEAAAFDLLPDYLIHVRAGGRRSTDHATLLEACCAGLRAKVVVEIDDLLAPSPIAGGNPVFGGRNHQLAQTAMELNALYVLQSSSANLVRLRDALLLGMTFAGPSLFSIYVGAAGNPDGLPAYLIAAAATESRAFPTFVYDPSAGPDWAARLRLADNPQVERDWPVQTISYEDEAHQRVSDSLPFTLVDLIACDRRYGKHFARVPPANRASSMVPVSEMLGADQNGPADRVPYLLMVDRDNRLHKVLVTERLVQEARRCADMWRSLQELGGIHDRYAATLPAHEQDLRERPRQTTANDAVPAPTEGAPAAPAATAATPVPDTAVPSKPSDDPYIETPRCTSCNECTQINDKMFAYDANKQAFIANPDAGTYRQLVEAAESCQVAIIHPGKPRNPNEPGLEELLRRAEPFL